MSTETISVCPASRESEVHQSAPASASVSASTKLINLSLNENPETPLEVLAGLVPGVLAAANLYPTLELTAFTQELARLHHVSESEILVTNGATDAIWMLAQHIKAAYPDLGAALIPECTFIAYKLACRAVGLPVIHAPMGPDLNLDFDALRRELTPAVRVVFFANPNNPTGAVCSPRELERFLAWVPASVLVVVDEAYRAFAEPSELPDTASLMRQNPNLLVLHSFSKQYGIAGLRLGYMIGEAQRLAQLKRMRGPFSVNLLALLTGRRLLAHPEIVARAAAANHRRRKALAAALTRLGITVHPSSANFLMAEFAGGADAVARVLLHHGILVRSLSDYELANRVRITVGTDEANAHLITALEAILQRPAPGGAAAEATPHGG